MWRTGSDIRAVDWVPPCPLPNLFPPLLQGKEKKIESLHQQFFAAHARNLFYRWPLTALEEGEGLA